MCCLSALRPKKWETANVVVFRVICNRKKKKERKQDFKEEIRDIMADLGVQIEWHNMLLSKK